MKQGINVLSLFDGMSCGRIALERAGVKVNKYYASEIDKHAIEVSKSNYPDIVQLGSVEEFKNWGIDWNSIDLIIGGSPCQGFSSIGKQLNFEDPRSKLFFTFLDIRNKVTLQNPAAKFLLENVRMNQEVKDLISDLMGVQPIFICSSNFSAQKRKRLYWTNIEFSRDFKSCTSVLSDILIQKEHDEKLYLSQAQIERAIRKHSAQTYRTGTRMGQVKFPTPINEKSKCMTAVTVVADRSVTHIQDAKGIRILCAEERELLQTVPLNYTRTASDSQRCRMLGNGWTVDVIAHIFRGLINQTPEQTK